MISNNFSINQICTTVLRATVLDWFKVFEGWERDTFSYIQHDKYIFETEENYYVFLLAHILLSRMGFAGVGIVVLFDKILM